MTINIKLLRRGDDAVLRRVADGVFDNPVDPALVAEFLADPRHHIAVAVDGGTAVGFASGVHYVHPDKKAQLFVNEVGVAPTHQGKGLGKKVLARLLEEGRRIGCVEAWVGTEPDNTAARALYASQGGSDALGPFVGYEWDWKDQAGPAQ